MIHNLVYPFQSPLGSRREQISASVARLPMHDKQAVVEPKDSVSFADTAKAEGRILTRALLSKRELAALEGSTGRVSAKSDSLARSAFEGAWGGARSLTPSPFACNAAMHSKSISIDHQPKRLHSKMMSLEGGLFKQTVDLPNLTDSVPSPTTLMMLEERFSADWAR